MADVNLQLIDGLLRRGTITEAEAEAYRSALQPAAPPPAERRTRGPQDPLAQIQAVAKAQAQARAAGAVNVTPASPLEGMVAGRPLVGHGLEGIDVDREGIATRLKASGKNPQEVLDEISLYNPDASQHISNLLRLCLPGNLVITAYRVVGGKRTKVVDEEATEDIRDWALSPDRIGRVYGGGLQALGIVQLRTLITAGALAAELEPTATLDDIQDVHPVYPLVVDTMVKGRDVFWVYRHKGAGDPTILSPTQFIYIPLDPLLKQPHGVPMFLPALETHFMLTEVLRSFVRAARNQGWSRLGVKVLYSVCYDAACQALGMSPDQPEDPEALYEYLGRYLTKIQTEYQKLDPDSAWIHWDWAEPDTVGADHAGQSLDPEKAIKAIEQVHISALKALPTTLGRQWGNALSSAGSIEYKLYAATGEALRSALHTFASWVCTQRLRLQGREAYAVVTQPEIRKDELGIEADAFLKRVTGYQLAVAAGFTDNERAALDLFGAPPAAPGPVAPPPSAESMRDIEYQDELSTLRVPAIPAEDQRVTAQDVERSTDFYDYLRQRGSPASRKALGILEATQISPARSLLLGGSGTRADEGEDEGDGWAYNRRTHRYRTPDGRYASPGQIRGYLDEYLGDIAARNAEATRQLAEGGISQARYLQETRERLKEAHITARAMAVGGRSVMGRADLAAIDVGYGRDIRALQRMAGRLEDGVITPAQAVGQSMQYGQASVRRTFDTGAREVRANDTWEQGRRVLTPGAEHCDTCLREAAASWVGIDRLGAIGATDCGGNDACSFEYRYRPSKASPDSRGMGQPFPSHYEYLALVRRQLAAGEYVRGVSPPFLQEGRTVTISVPAEALPLAGAGAIVTANGHTGR